MSAEDVFFTQARRAFWHRVLDWALRRCSDLLEYNQTMRGIPLAGQHDLGVQIVPVSKIVGTVGRGSDFDREFRPRRNDMLHRWIQIQKLYDRNGIFPVVELYKIGDQYFVVDGHHRVSVARANHVAYLDARVIEVSAAQPRPAYA